MRLCYLQCLVVLIISVLTAFGQARHSKLPDLAERKHKFSATYCGKLQHECDLGICPKCCLQYKKGCEHDYNDIQKVRSEKELEEQIRRMNAPFSGEQGIEKLSQPVVLEDGTEITLHRREDLQEVLDIKSILAGGNEVDTPFFGLDVILTVEQARDMLNHSNLDSIERPKRSGSYSYSWSSRSGAARTGQAASQSSSYRRQSANVGRRASYGGHSGTAGRRYSHSGQNRNYGYEYDYNQGGMAVNRRTIRKWPRTVHYVYDQEAARNPQAIRTTRSVAGYMNKHSCLNLVHGLPPNCAHGGGARCADNYIVIAGGQGGGCSSSLGMTGGAQAIHMGGNCGQFGAGYRQVSQTLGAPASQGCTTFQSTPTPVVQQSAMTPSFCNMRTLNNMYCQNSCNHQQNNCWNGGYQNPANCGSCICPPNYSGQHCETPCGGSEPEACPVQPCTEVQCEAPCPTGYTGDTCQTRCGDTETTTCPTQPECREVACPPEPECRKVECPPQPVCRENRECPPPPRCREVECNKPDTIINKDCQVSSWSGWSHCDRTCGGACTQFRSRSITQNAHGSGAPCPELHEEQSQALPDCPVPVDCEVSEWSSWSTCSQSCGGDCQVERHREVLQRASYGGRSCSTYGLHEMKTLVMEHCPIDCELSHWSQWSQCHQTCGDCVVRRWRSVIRHAQFGGKSCDDSWFGGGGGALEETKPHTMPECIVSVDCEVSSWSDWTECLQTCGICERVRYRQVVSHAEGVGRPCSDEQYRLAESRTEDLGECQRTENCRVCNWSTWSGCQSTCGTCRVIRKRSITNYPTNGGSPCPRKMVETATIRQRGCPSVEWQPRSEDNV